MDLLRMFSIVFYLCLLCMVSISSSECGRSSSCQQGYVFGGLSTCAEEFPWNAALVDTSTIVEDDEIKIFCGASIVSANFLISAGHCFKYRKGEIDRTKDTVRVYIGLDHRLEPNRGSTYHFIESQEIYPDWLKTNRFDEGHDIAIIKVATPIEFTPIVSPICLPSIEQEHLVQVGISVKMAGFGSTASSNINGPQNLRKGDFKIVDCGEPKNICAAEIKNGRVIRDTCNGDSGGGLVAEENGSFFLVGIVSWGRECGDSNFTTRYVNVLDHLQWIKSKIEVCFSVTGSKCILPFRLNRKRHDECISSLKSRPGKTFAAKCPTKIDSRGEGGSYENCNHKCPGFKKQVHGIWQSWSSWTGCSGRCQSGLLTTRFRNCSTPQYGGHSCKGDRTQEDQCKKRKECEKFTTTVSTNDIEIAQTKRKCSDIETCEIRENCPYIENKYKETAATSGKQKKSLIDLLKTKVCNTEMKGFCCPPERTDLKEIFNLPLPFHQSTPVKYETHQELMDRFEIYAVKFPRLAATNSIGRSVDGRELKYLKLTQGADQERKLLKPMIKFIANIHGDETVGRQMLQYLAQDLIHSYNSGDPFAEFLLNNTEIYLLPDMNPDGFHKSSPGPRPSYTNNYTCPHSTPGRVNSNGKDLNLDFPHLWTFRRTWDGRWNSISLGRQPETLAVLNWTFSNPFVLSANFQSGALVARYPYDTLKPSRKWDDYEGKGLAEETPDQELFNLLATIYSENNIDMFNQRQENANEWHRLHKCSKGYGGPFENGITNGALWYNLEGGMQDFNYAYTNCMEITLELSCCKYPPPEMLKDYWIHNRNSLLYYTEAAHLGVKGLVRDSLGNPIYNAIITVRNNKKKVTSSKRGEYWRLLLPGNYTLTASADGYESKTASIHIPQKNVNTWETPAQRHDFELTKKKVKIVG